MTIIVIILCVIAFILFLFYRDTNQEIKTIKQQGGLTVKYSELIDCFSRIGLKIHSITDSTLIMMGHSNLGSIRVAISPSFGNTIIEWLSNDYAAGRTETKRNYPDSIPQFMMYQQFTGHVYSLQLPKFANALIHDDTLEEKFSKEMKQDIYRYLAEHHKPV